MKQFKPDPELYERMAEPFANREEAGAALYGFRDELARLREKYHIAELVGVIAVWSSEEESDDKKALTSLMFAFGNPAIGYELLKKATVEQATMIADHVVEASKKLMAEEGSEGNRH